MEDILANNFNEILNKKMAEIENLLTLKKKTTNVDNTNEINYLHKQTINKIYLEADRKMKASKAYKKKQNEII